MSGVALKVRFGAIVSSLVVSCKMFLWIFPLVILSIIGCFVGLWLWTMFLENAKPPQARMVLYAVLSIVQVMEFFVWSRGVLKGYTIVFIVFCNFWGMLDAILRYPVVHDIDSFFSIKLILIIAAKTMVYALGFRNMGRNAIVFLACLFGCVWSVPLLYAMALPIGDTRSQQAKHDVRDIDIFTKIYRLLAGKGTASDEMRAEVRHAFRYYRDQVCFLLAKAPGMAPLLIRANLVDKRMVRRQGTREI